MVLRDADELDGWNTMRARLCVRMLDRSLHQLHQAADDLRQTAIECCRRADRLDAAHRARVA